MERPAVCARMECWFEPDPTATSKSLSTINNRLHDQYRKWHPSARFKVIGDPTIVDLHKQCKSTRKNAKHDRVLFHYNGHGVPMPTETGEIWLFNSNYTKYIPLNLTDLQNLVGNPSLYVFDCNAAGRIINYFRSAAADIPFLGEEHTSHYDASRRQESDADRDCVVLAACGPNEKLPVDPKLPADLFTSCLTTPIRTALFCYASRSLVTGVTPEMIDRMPGSMDDRNTPLGDLARIFTTVSDTIAWNVLPRDLFKRLFRQDLLLASMMRNFLLASRIMRFHGCTPESIPALPETHNHPLWDSFEYTMEQYLAQVPSNFRMQKAVQAEKEYREQFNSALPNEMDQNINGIHKATLMREESRNAGYLSSYNWYRYPIQAGYSVTSGPILTHNLSYEASSFFDDHIKAFEVWLDMANESFPPQQLPILLLLLIQPKYRQKGLQLLSRFLQIGRKAVEQALSIGVFPYILTYLNPGPKNSGPKNSAFLPELVLIWGKILAFDPKCKTDLAKISAHNHFVNFLSPAHDCSAAAPKRSGVHLAVALFIVSIFGTHPNYAYECQRYGICDVCLGRLNHDDPLVRRWACLCLSQILQNGRFQDAGELLHIADAIAKFALVDDTADVRAAGVSAIAEVLFCALRLLHSKCTNLRPNEMMGNESLTGSYGRLVSGEYHGFDRLSGNVPKNIARENFDSPRLLEIKIVNQVGREIARMGLRNSSVLVRREVAIALSQVARLNPRPFVTAANEFPGITDKMLERIRSNVQLSPYSEMWLTLLELALDSHPVVASHARSSFDMIATHTFGSPGSGFSTSDSSSSTHDTFDSPFIPVFGTTGTSVEDIRENRRNLVRDNDRDEIRNVRVPDIPSPTRLDGSGRDVLSNHSGRTRQSLPIRLSREPTRNTVHDVNHPVVHVRGSSGRFNLNSLAPQRRIPRVNSASVINLNDVSSLNASSSSLELRHGRNDNEPIAISPKFHLGFALTHMMSVLWRPQSSGRNAARSNANVNGSTFNTDRTYTVDRVASPPRTQRRSRSYQVLPPENAVLDSLAVSYEQDENDLLNRMQSNELVGPNNEDTNSGFPHRSQRPPVEKAVDSLFSWSCACMSRISVDSSGPDHMPEPDPVPQYTKLWDSILRQDNEQYLGSGQALFLFNSESPSLPREGVEFPHEQISRVSERRTHFMGAGGGAVVSLAFLPREIGREGDEYIVTGDSTGSVGVYDTQSGECQSSFGIPAPPGVPDVEVTSVLCLNGTENNSRAFMQHTPLILAGAYDGRVAVFRPDLVTKKYSVLSSFQASGRSLWSNFRKNQLADDEKSRDKMSNGGNSRMNGAPEMKALLHSSGNGLVMDFQWFNHSLYASGCEHNMLRVWDLSKEMCSWEGEVMDKGVWPTSVSSPPWSSYHTVVVGASNGSVTLVDTRTRSRAQNVKVFGEHNDPIVSTAYGLWVGEGRGETIVSADCEGCIKLWDPRMEGETKRSEVKAHDTNLTAMAAHSSGNYIASGSTNKCVKLFRAKLASPEMIRYRNSAGSLPGVREQIAPVTGLAFQQEPCSLAVGCSDSTVSVYDLETR